MKKIYFLLVAMMVTSMSFGQELLLNGDLEAWDDSTTPSSWTKAEALTQETTDFNGGANAAKRDGGSGTKDLAQTVTVTGGDSYTISFWYKASGDGTDARIWSYWKSGGANITDNANELRGPNNSYLSNNGTVWTQYTTTLSAPATADELYFEVRSYSNSVVIWDDLSVMHNAVAPAVISITSPTNASTLISGDVNFAVSVSNFNVDLTTGTGDGHIHWDLDSGTQTGMKYDTTDMLISGLSIGAHTMVMTLVDNGHVPIVPATSSTVNFTVAAVTQITDIAALRAGTTGEFYELTGEALLTFQQSYRGQKFIEDNSGAILIDDTSGLITSTYAIADGITGIKGQLGEFGGMMQFIPAEDPGTASSTGNTLTPQTVTLATLAASPENYESELVTVTSVMMSNTVPAATPNFTGGIVHEMDQGGNNFNFRSTFFSVDYIGELVPTVATDVTGIVNERSGSLYFLTARDADDISQVTLSIADNKIEGFSIFPNPTSANYISITTANNTPKNVQVFDMLGKKIIDQEVATKLNITALQTGIYIVKVTENNLSATKRLIVK